MQEQIKELYRKLYNQNIELLEEKKSDVKEENVSNATSVAKSVVSRFILRIVIYIVFFILLQFMIRFMVNDITPDGRPGQASLSLLPIIIVISLIVMVISFIYQIIIRPRRTIQRNYWVKNNVDNKEEYNNVFCERICKPIVEYAIPNSQYEHNNGISKELYESMGFSNSHDSYTSSDNIRLVNKSNLILSKVHTKFKDGGASGYWYATLFCGIASINTLPFNIPFNIRIRNKSLDSLKLKNKIQIDNDEFDRYYEIETDNIQLLNRYFNSKILNYFVELAKRNQRLEVNISQNHIYIRLHDKDFLEFNIKSEANEEKIIDSCNSIIAIINTNDFLVNELKNNI